MPHFSPSHAILSTTTLATAIGVVGIEASVFGPGAEASALAGDPGVAVIQARPSDARSVANTRIDPNVEIVPRSTRKSRIELVVEPNLVMPFE